MKQMLLQAVLVASVALAIVAGPWWHGAVLWFAVWLALAAWWVLAPRKSFDRVDVSVWIASLFPIGLVVARRGDLWMGLFGDRFAWGAMWAVVGALVFSLARGDRRVGNLLLVGGLVGHLIVLLAAIGHLWPVSSGWLLLLAVSMVVTLPGVFRALQLVSWPDRHRLGLFGVVLVMQLVTLWLLGDLLLCGLWMVSAIFALKQTALRGWRPLLGIGIACAALIAFLSHVFVPRFPLLIPSWRSAMGALRGFSGGPELWFGSGLNAVTDLWWQEGALKAATTLSVPEQTFSVLTTWPLWFGLAGSVWLLVVFGRLFQRGAKHTLAMSLLVCALYPIAAPLPLLHAVSESAPVWKVRRKSVRYASWVMCGAVSIGAAFCGYQLAMVGVWQRLSADDLAGRITHVSKRQPWDSVRLWESVAAAARVWPSRSTSPTEAEIIAFQKAAQRLQRSSDLPLATVREIAYGYRALIPFVDGSFERADAAHLVEIGRAPELVAAHEERLETWLLEREVLATHQQLTQSFHNDLQGVLDALLKIDPQNTFARFESASRLLQEGQSEAAEPLLAKLTVDAPTDAGVWYQYGLCLLTNKKPAAAEKALRQAVTLVPGWANARWYLADALVAQQKPRDAIAVLEPLLLTDPKNQQVKDRLVELRAKP